MTQAFMQMNTHSPIASGSGVKPKRKRMSWLADESETHREVNKLMRVRSPPFRHVDAFNQPPELLTDHSNSASDEDQAMDQDLDQDMDDGMSSSAHQEDSDYLAKGAGFRFSNQGSGGFGFGPGAEEDCGMDAEDESEGMSSGIGIGSRSMGQKSHSYPIINPTHFSQIPQYSSPAFISNTTTPSPSTATILDPFNQPQIHQSTPISAQSYSTTLRPAPSRGLMQPTMAAPLPANATDVERARAVHGPQCHSIPKLTMSPYPDPATGQRSMWSMCPDCGACEMAQ